MLGNYHLEARQTVSFLSSIIIYLSAILLGLTVSTIILLSSGLSIINLWNEFILLLITSPKNLSAVIVQSAPLVLVGLAAAISFKVRFWNIGIEGQIIFGAIAATYVAIHNIGPPGFRLLLMGLASAAGGIFWIALPILLKIKLKVNEIITTLLLNYIAFNFLLHLLYGNWKDPDTGFPSSELYDASELFRKIGWYDVNSSVFVISIFVILSYFTFYISRFGFLTKFLNSNLDMARSMGISVVFLISFTALISGGLSGVCGFVISAGIESRMTQSFFVGYGFSGILIAFLARENPIGVVIVAILFSMLMIGGQSLQVFYQVPFAMVQLVQAIIVMTVAGSEFFLRYKIRRHGQ